MLFEITKSTSTELEVIFSDTLKLVGKRRGNRLTGVSFWDTYFYKYGDVRKRDPFGGTYIEKCWFLLKGNTIKGIKMAKQWNKKSDIMDALNELKNL